MTNAATVGLHSSWYYPVGRSRAELRTMIAQVFGHETGKATGNGTTTTIVDSRLSRFADDFWIGAQVWVERKPTPATGYTAYVTDFVGSTGTLTFTPALSGGTATGDAYQLFRNVTKDRIEDALNEVCKGGEAIHALTPNSDLSLDYSLNDILTLHRPTQILDVIRRSLGDTGNAPQRIAGWHIEDNAGVLTLRLPAPVYTGDDLWVLYEIGEGGLVRDDDRTSLPAALVRSRAVVWLLDTLLLDQDEQGLAKIGQLARYWRERLDEAERTLPRPARPTIDQPWGDATSVMEQPWGSFGLESVYA